jgi:hypothetical protein
VNNYKLIYHFLGGTLPVGLAGGGGVFPTGFAGGGL